MMRRDLFDILGYASGKGLRTSLTPTTTRLVTVEKLRQVKDAGVRRVAVSIDGPSAEAHDAFRGFKGSFDMALKIARDGRRKPGLSLQVNTTVSRYNVGRLDEFIDLVSSLNAVQWSLFFLVPTGRGALGDMISPEEHERVFNWLYGLSGKAPFDIKSTAAPAYRRVVIQKAVREWRQRGDAGRRRIPLRGRPQPSGAGRQRRQGLLLHLPHWRRLPVRIPSTAGRKRPRAVRRRHLPQLQAVPGTA